MGSRAALLGLFALVLSCALADGAHAAAPSGAAGTVAGIVIDKRTGGPIAGADLELVGTGAKVRSDIDGRYTIRAAPGAYALRVSAVGYQRARLTGVAVTSGTTTTVDASLEPLGTASVEVIEVVAEADTATEETQLLLRKKADVLSDTISAEVMKKTPGSAAADLVKRAPAVTVKDNKFLFVRGLSERYTAATLNGSKLPSTDPNRRAVPLDLFPAEFLESLSIIKSYTPDLPGDFSGGLAELRLRNFPTQLKYGLSIKGGANSQTTFSDFDTYEGSKYDPFGYGAGFREIPAGTPNPLDNESPSRFSQARRFRDIWSVDTITAPPDLEVNASVGNTLGPLGFQLGGIFANGYRFRTERQKQFRNSGDLDDPEISLSDDFLADRSTYETGLGGILTAAYKIDFDHTLSLRTLFSHASEDQVKVSEGETENLGFDSGLVQQQTEFEYQEEQLVFSQFAGEHEFGIVRVDWRSAIAQTIADQPDTRFQARNGPAGGPFVFVEDSLGGQRLYNQMDEILSDTGVDVTVPFDTRLPFTDVWSGLAARLKLGAGYLYRDRHFEQRRFRYIVPPGAFDTTLPTEVLLAPGNIEPGGVDFEELTAKRDKYDASEEVLGAYGMLDLPIVRDRLRLVGGVRYEDSDITLHVFNDEADLLPTEIPNKNVNFLPGVSLIYSPIDDMNLRLAYSQTVSRPDFRELSPAEFPAQRGERAQVGNPFLEQADITSYDARWEWFFSPTEILSVGFFYKELTKPIEQTVIQRASDLVNSFANADSGWVYGLEFEGRKNFEFLWPRLRDLSILSNATWADSEVTAPRGSTLEVQTNTTRKLQGQPKFIVNLALEYAHPRFGTARLLYNVIDDRISDVGTFGLPDIVETRRHQLDAVLILPLKDLAGFPLSLRLGVSNILNEPVEYTQGSQTQYRYTTGVSFGFGLSYSH
jgi:outer membrane receptor protein involved in Fe transport